MSSSFYISLEVKNKAKDIIAAKIINTELDDIVVIEATISTKDLDVYINDLL